MVAKVETLVQLMCEIPEFPILDKCLKVEPFCPMCVCVCEILAFLVWDDVLAAVGNCSVSAIPILELLQNHYWH